MRRIEMLRNIDRDQELKDEILTRLDEEATLPERLRPALVAAELEGTLESVPPSTVSPDRARELIESPDRIEDLALEAIVMVMGRPVLLVKNDDFDLDDLETDTWRSRMEQSRENLTNAIRSVGRIDLDNNPSFDWVGTGWVVSDDVIVTNRHVASTFANRSGEQFVFRSSFLGPMGARLDFAEEIDSVAAAEFRIARVLHIEEDPGPDMAFLQIDWTTNESAGRRDPISLAGSVDSSHNVAVIGYPAKDTRTNIPADMDRIFGEVYNVKRLAPGELNDTLDQGRVLTHDCTTLGGNSGSVVLDMSTGEAVALHFAGREKDRNFAVAASAVRTRLEQLLSAGSGAGSLVPAVTPEPELSTTIEGLDDRVGYDPAFLGPNVPLPSASPKLEASVAPVIGRDDGVLDYLHYSIRMHRDRRLAIYTAVNIDGMQARNVRRGSDRWSLDPRIDREFQVGNELYRHNKLDRGHLVRRLDPAWGSSFEKAEKAVEDTFFYTNCAPQHKTLNRDLWLDLEDHILKNTNVRDLKVSVFTGPIFRENDRRYREFMIPEDFWKVVTMVDDETGALSATGYVVSQRDFMDNLEFAFGAFRTYQVPLAVIETQTDLDFGSLKDFDPLAAVETLSVRPLTALSEIIA